MLSGQAGTGEASDLDEDDSDAASHGEPSDPGDGSRDCTGRLTFDDADLERAVKLAALGVDQEDLFEHHVRDLTKVNAFGIKEIESLGGIECLPALERLFLDRNSIRDLSPLAELLRIKDAPDMYVSLQGNSVEDLGPLATTSRTLALSLQDNLVSDLAPLTKGADLLYLHVSGNPIDCEEQAKNVEVIAQEVGPIWMAPPGALFTHDCHESHFQRGR